MASKFLWSFHYFRAFAILNIVVLHLWVLPNNGSSLVRFQMVFKELIFHSSTLYFLFISGFLVMHLKEKLTWKRFYLAKFRNVLLPYLIISIALIVLYAVLGSEKQIIDRAFLSNSMLALIYGKVNFHLWYIPFIIPIFLLTPFLLKIPLLS